jgi:hypothetical protein
MSTCPQNIGTLRKAVKFSVTPLITEGNIHVKLKNVRLMYCGVAPKAVVLSVHC